MKTIEGYDVKIYTDNIEESALEQIKELLSINVFSDKKIRIMPDVHAGAGCVIGFTGDLGDKVIPNIVGVDIGCGMRVLNLGKLADIDYHAFHEHIRSNVPSGKIVREDSFGFKPLAGEEMEIYREAKKLVSRLYCYRDIKDSGRINRAIGSLGGGNHFIELDKDDEGNVYLVIHTGSRNLGKQVGDYYNEKAEALNRRWFSSVPSEIQLPFLPMRTDEFRQYWAEMSYCIDFALANRRLMMQRIQEVIGEVMPGTVFEPMINIAHNYAAFENHFGEDVIVHRKGATLAREGAVGIIPGSQGTCSYITEGLGNPESFMSCSHGAGRRLSRSEAVNTLSMESEIAMLERQGIVHSIRTKTDLEEAAGAYKNIDEVMEAQSDLVKIRTKLMPIAVIKG